MNFGDPKPSIFPDRPGSEIETIETKRRIEDFVRSKIHELLLRAGERSDKRSFVLDQLVLSGNQFFQGKEHILTAALEKISTVPESADEDFEEALVREMTDAIMAFMRESGFSEEAAKAYFRRMSMEQSGNTLLDENAVLYYSRYEDAIEIHITKGLTRKIWEKAMSKLAQVVQTDESVKVIGGNSWVVMDHPSFFERYGFTVREITDEEELGTIRADFDEGMEGNRDKPIAEVSMTREEFLKRWLKTTE